MGFAPKVVQVFLEQFIILPEILTKEKKLSI